MLPRSTYTAPDEDKSSVRGVEGMGAKERVTLYLASDASGRKLPLAMIGHSKGPRCFRLRIPPFKCFSQTNAWSDSRVWPVVEGGASSVGTSSHQQTRSPHHGQPQQPRQPGRPRGQVTVLELPPNCTAKHQPADAGIIAALKELFRTLLLRIRVDTMNSAAQLRAEAKRRKVVSGCQGLAEGHSPHLLDAAELCQDAWDRVSTETVRRCVHSLALT